MTNEIITDTDSPVFIFSAGWRSGSTMLQRLITSSGEVLVWGESGGALNAFRDAYLGYRQMLGEGGTKYELGYGGNGAAQFREFVDAGSDGAGMWVASMNPPEDHVLGCLRESILRIYHEPARELGYKRWGVKDVLADAATAHFMLRLFPGARIVFLVRNPMHCLLSIKRRSWLGMAPGLKAVSFYSRHWRELVRSFTDSGIGRLLYYEEVIADSSALAELAGYLSLPELHTDFISSSQADWPAQNASSLSWLERLYAGALLAGDMKRHGYR